jgi:CBS domain-containing protein
LGHAAKPHGVVHSTGTRKFMLDAGAACAYSTSYIVPLKFCATHNTLNTAAQNMWDNDIGCVPVVDKDRRVVGMLTDRDVCMAAYIQGAPLTGLLVTSAMSKQVFSCAPDDDIAAAEKLMREKQVRRLAVIDAQGRLAGIISLNDIAREG